MRNENVNERDFRKYLIQSVDGWIEGEAILQKGYDCQNVKRGSEKINLKNVYQELSQKVAHLD